MPKQPFFYCEKCGVVFEEQTHVETRAQSGQVRGELITVEMPLRVCNVCGEELSDTELDDASLIATYDVYRERHNLIFPAQIVEVREKYGLSQKNLALLLGLGEVTVHRYETGALAEVAPSKLLRLMENPVNMREMLAESGDKIPPSARAKVQARLDGVELAPRPRLKRASTSPLSDIEARLGAFGFKSREVEALKHLVLPSRLAQAKTFDARQRSDAEEMLGTSLGLEMASLRDPQAQLCFVAQSGYFKSHRNAPPARESLVCGLGNRLGQLVATASGQEQPLSTRRAASLDLSAASIRAEILATGAPWIGLRELLEWSWNHGLPVVKATLPDGLKRWDGMALRPRPTEKPVSLSFCAHCRPSWQAFIVAHELGHHLLGHVTPDAPELDEDIKSGPNPQQGEERKQREGAANDFARELLTDDQLENEPLSGWKWDTPAVFAPKIQAYAVKHRIHPGVVAFGLFRQVPNRKGLCMEAAKIVDPEEAAPIFTSFYSRLNASVWSDEEAFLFGRFTAPSD